MNSQKGSQWKLWEQANDYPSRSLLAFRASEAARRQGEAAFARFHIELLKARHVENRDIASMETINQIAEATSLDMARFSRDLSDRRLLSRLAEDHTLATETLGVFGVPTLVFPERQVIFLKLSALPSPEESIPLFSEVCHLAQRRTCVEQIKRPRRDRK